MMSGWSRRARACRALFRVEQRQLRAHPWRSLLVALLVAVPVAAVVGGATLASITTKTPAERLLHAMGGASLRVTAPLDTTDARRLRALLPADARVAEVFQGQEKVAVPGRQLRAECLALGGDTLALGMFRLTEGRLPTNSGEVALSSVLLEGLRRSLGESVTLAYGPSRTITGIVTDPENIDTPLVVRTAAAAEHNGVRYLLMDLAADRSLTLADDLTAAGFTVTTARSVEARSESTTPIVFALGGIGFLEAALVIASAFAVGLQRRRYEFGLLGSTGASPSLIFASLVASAMAVAAVGGAFGAAIGAAAAALVHPHLDEWNRRVNGPLEIAPAHVAFAIALGIVTAMLAAALPSAQVARLPIREALSGRRPLRTRSTGWLCFGLLSVALSLALLWFGPRDMAVLGAISLVGGSILGVLGFGACSPWLLDGLARSAAPLPLAWRLAVRDAGRFGARNGPVVTAVLAAMSMTVTISVLVASIEAAVGALPRPMRDDQLLVEGPDAEQVAQQLQAEFPTVAAAPLTVAYFQGHPVRAGAAGAAEAPSGAITVGGPDLLRVLDAEGASGPFQLGRLVQLSPSGETNTSSQAVLSTWTEGRELARIDRHLLIVDQHVGGPRFVLELSELERYGMEAGPPPGRALTPWMIRLRTPVTAEMVERAGILAASSIRTTVDAGLLHRQPGRGFYHAILWICIGTSLIVVLVATALSSAESAQDRRVLLSVGASQGVLRAHNAARTGYLALLGCLLAVPAGLIPAIGMFQSANLPLPFVAPWRDLAVILLALPSVAYATSWLFTRATLSAADSKPGALLLLLLLPGALFSFSSARAESAQPRIAWTPYEGKDFYGAPLSGELGRLRVPESRGNLNGREIELAFVRYRTTNPRPGPPIFFLAGGPGAPGVELCGPTATHPQMRLLEHRDVIGLDQRGTGLSAPDSAAATSVVDYLPHDRAVDRNETIAAFDSAARRCVAAWRTRGIDVSAYTTVESADDIEAVRAALGEERLMLFGSSYGSHLGLAYLRRHPDRVERAFLSKVEGPDHTWKLPSSVQRHLEEVHVAAAADSAIAREIPDLLGLVRTLLHHLEASPIQSVVRRETGDSVRVVVSAHDLRVLLANSLSYSKGIAGIPRLLYDCSRGDWTRLAESALESREIEVEAMPVLMDCASGATPARRARIEQEAHEPENLLGDAIFSPFYPSACRACGAPDLGDAFRAPFSCDVPVMFVSGTLDVRTPPENVDDLLAGFTNAAHILVENTGHDSRELMSEEYRDLMQAFLRGEAIASCVVSLPRVRFEPIE